MIRCTYHIYYFHCLRRSVYVYFALKFSSIHSEASHSSTGFPSRIPVSVHPTLDQLFWIDLPPSVFKAFRLLYSTVPLFSIKYKNRDIYIYRHIYTYIRYIKNLLEYWITGTGTVCFFFFDQTFFFLRVRISGFPLTEDM